MHSFALPSGQCQQGIKVLNLDAALQRVFLRQFKASGLGFIKQTCQTLATDDATAVDSDIDDYIGKSAIDDDDDSFD
ncbi:hypothetical protein FOPG_18276 [Fusarium oxysporum f. sp. conglutinans race 2 54008]|uniref:Uncharacterized protein n=1 Tax=Fusarium oxysporum f. sp. conglutinans race 2 54008 TaxID=1089457 RepID=X0HWG5_FUSOX|nr:hypothetical protein FOPG_18276 [Fusarium oxysporum f. sp. conglutinans race 2 54008]